MSFWQYQAAVNGYVEANSPEDKNLSQDEIEALGDFIENGEN